MTSPSVESFNISLAGTRFVVKGTSERTANVNVSPDTEAPNIAVAGMGVPGPPGPPGECDCVFGEIALLVDEKYATPGQMNGTEDASTAIQAALDDPINASRIVFPPGTRWWFSGAQQVYLRSHVWIDLMGTTFFKTDGAGYYNVFTAVTDPNASEIGWGSGVVDVRISNGYFEGDLSIEGGSICMLTANHASDFVLENLEFVGCLIGGHLFDLAGCQDFLFDNIIMRGYKPPESGSVPRHEAIQLDQSARGTGAYDPGNYSGLLCRRMTITNIRSYPLTKDGVTYPAPNPVGAHSQREGHWYDDISIDRVLVVDPPLDPASTGMGEDGYIRGVIHFPTVRRFSLTRYHVVSTTGQGSIRAVMIQGRASGATAASDPNLPDSEENPRNGPWAVAQRVEDVVIEATTVGMGGTDSIYNPMVVVSGTNTVQNTRVRIKLNTDRCFKEAIFLNRTDDAEVDMMVSNAESGIRILNCNRTRVTGNVTDVNLPVRPQASFKTTVHELTGDHSVGATNFINLTAGSDFVSITGCQGSGWTNLVSAAPANYAEAGNVGWS